jgi:hypothetical protein
MEANKFDYKSLSLQGQYVWRLCKQVMRDLKDGKCTDEEINRIASNIDADKNGYIHPDDYLPAEKAMKELRVHRNQFFALTKEHNIQCKKINGHSIGYHKNDIQRLRNALKEKK